MEPRLRPLPLYCIRVCYFAVQLSLADEQSFSDETNGGWLCVRLAAHPCSDRHRAHPRVTSLRLPQPTTNARTSWYPGCLATHNEPPSRGEVDIRSPAAHTQPRTPGLYQPYVHYAPLRSNCKLLETAELKTRVEQV